MTQYDVNRAAARAEAARLRTVFEQAGAIVAECPILMPADVMLDLYGEDIRTRAYVTQDPGRGEMMLRPDFTLSVVEQHMATGAEPARYTYSGEVFRRQEVDPTRPSEYQQVGFELFDRTDSAAADAEVFALFATALKDYPLEARTGDIGILTAAVQGLDLSDIRRDTLLRHIWRPKRFAALLDRYCGRTDVPESRKRLLAATDPMDQAGPLTGLRSAAEIEARISVLKDGANEPDLPVGQVELIEALLAVSETCPYALTRLRDLAIDLPGISHAVARFARRCEALDARGVDVSALMFKTSYGLSTMEYYDGFVFGFEAEARHNMPLIASGGRYDALTQRLGKGQSIPAVGGVVRPEMLLALEGLK